MLQHFIADGVVLQFRRLDGTPPAPSALGTTLPRRFQVFTADGSSVWTFRSWRGGASASASVDLACSYALRNAGASDLSCAYAVQGMSAVDLVVSYDVRQAAATDLLASYTIAANAGTADLAAAYVVLNGGVAQLACAYELQSGVVRRYSTSRATPAPAGRSRPAQISAAARPAQVVRRSRP